MCQQLPSSRQVGILLGWGSPYRGRFGFVPAGPAVPPPPDEPLWYHGNNHLMAKEWAEVMGVEPGELVGLGREEAGLFVQGEFSRCRRADYLKDRAFRGQYDDNPRFALLKKETEDASLAV